MESGEIISVKAVTFNTWNIDRICCGIEVEVAEIRNNLTLSRNPGMIMMYFFL
jgi:hypothetical protein